MTSSVKRRIDSAFTSVQGALSFFFTSYRQLADWRAVIARLDGFNIAAERARAAATATPAIAGADRGIEPLGEE